MMTETESNNGPFRKPGELVFSLLLLTFSSIALVLSVQIQGASLSGANVMPIMASALLLVTALLIVKETWSKPLSPTTQGFVAELAPRVLVNFFLLGIAYIALLTWFGFLIASFIYLLVAIFYLHRLSERKQGWLLALFVSVNSLAIIYVVFRLTFKVILPEGEFNL